MTPSTLNKLAVACHVGFVALLPVTIYTFMHFRALNPDEFHVEPQIVLFINAMCFILGRLLQRRAKS